MSTTKKASKSKSRESRGSTSQAPALGRPRTMILCGCLAALFGLLTWHLAHLQVVPGAEKGFTFLQKQGQARTLRQEKINAYRGVITDRNGELLAVSTPVKSLFANPQRLDRARLPELAKALSIAEAQLAEKLDQYADKQFVYLKRHMPPQEAENVLALNIPGVSAEEEFQRYYPAGEVAAHIVGFTDVDERGREGMELALDEWLAGAPGVKEVIKDLKGNVVKDLGVTRAASSGNDVKLTIDLRLQYLAYRELKAAIKSQGAVSGSVVVLDAQSGEVLAMANQPSYNPNNRNNIKPAQLRNRAVTDLFEPGSTMKPFTVVAALETGRYQPWTKIDTNPGWFHVAGKTYTDKRNLGVIDLTTLIQKSSQVGTTKLALDLDPNHVREVFYRLGLGQSTGIGFPGEAIGFLPNKEKWYTTERAAMAFGHGLSVTPLQLAQAYTTMANDGVLRPVSLVKQKELPEGSQVIEPKHAQQVMSMLKKVTQEGGTATRAQIKAYDVAGKTGTTHKVSERGGYAEDKYVAFFAGVAPADDPSIVVVVVVNEPPAKHYYGGEAAAPVFARVAEGALRLLNVAPSVQEQLAAR